MRFFRRCSPTVRGFLEKARFRRTFDRTRRCGKSANNLQVCIPAGHNGTVFVSAKSRIQGDPADHGGTVLLQINIDGNPVGLTGVQQLGDQPDSVSTRSVSASYLATGAIALSFGCCTARVVAKAFGDIRNLGMNADMPLLWFD